MPQGQIAACAVLGREDEVLMVRRRDGGLALPGGRVEPGEWVEDALDRGVREALGAGVSSASFLRLIRYTKPQVTCSNQILERYTLHWGTHRGRRNPSLSRPGRVPAAGPACSAGRLCAQRLALPRCAVRVSRLGAYWAWTATNPR
jgi:8-oxo-dGTP pyrophosphatase MutT (NUDIX family)